MRHVHIVTAEPKCALRAGAAVQATIATGDRLVIEDGWVFREHHGKFVECICRVDEVPPARLTKRQAGH